MEQVDGTCDVEVLVICQPAHAPSTGQANLRSTVGTLPYGRFSDRAFFFLFIESFLSFFGEKKLGKKSKKNWSSSKIFKEKFRAENFSRKI